MLAAASVAGAEQEWVDPWKAAKVGQWAVYVTHEGELDDVKTRYEVTEVTDKHVVYTVQQVGSDKPATEKTLRGAKEKRGFGGRIKMLVVRQGEQIEYDVEVGVEHH